MRGKRHRSVKRIDDGRREVQFRLCKGKGSGRIGSNLAGWNDRMIAEKSAGVATGAACPFEDLSAHVLRASVNIQSSRGRNNRVLPCCHRIVLFPERMAGRTGEGSIG